MRWSVVHRGEARRRGRQQVVTAADGGRRLLLYSHDGFGLGHLRRNLNVAGRLVAEWPGSSAVVVAGLPGIPGLDLPPGVDLVKLPSIRKVATETWHPRTLRVEGDRLRAMRRAVIEGLAETFDPDLVLVDYMPAGVWAELVPTLTRVRQRERAQPARIVLGLRDVLDAPEVTRSAWTAHGHADALRRLYDHVLVYGERDVYDTAAAYGLEELAPGRVTFTGYLTGPLPTGNPQRVRAELGLADDQPLVLVTAGGGGDAFPMMEFALAALSLLGEERPRPHVVVVTGPLMPRDSVASLERRGRELGATVKRTSARLLGLMGAADLVVTMAAYNTLAECLRLRRRIVVIPRPGPSAEQATRAEIFARRGLLTKVPSDASPADLASILAHELDHPRVLPPAPAQDGLDGAVAALSRLLAGPAESPAAPAPRRRHA
jgi:predicted glycosyltransferase